MRYAKKVMISAPTDKVTTALQNVLLTRNPRQSKLQNLEEDMKNILARTDLPDDTKLALYQQSLQQYLQYDHARKTAPMSVTVSAPSSETGGDQTTSGEEPSTAQQETDSVTGSNDLTPQILESVPKTLKRKARLLMDNLKNNDVMTWNKNGELVYDGNVVKGSNIIDLVNDTLRGKKGFTPLGFQYFVRGLAQANAPESLIGNEARRSVVRKYKEVGSVDKRLLPDPPTPTTPIRVSKRRRAALTPLRSKKRISWESM